MKGNNLITTEPRPEDRSQPYDRTWILVPVVAFGGALTGGATGVLVIGTAAAVLASFLLAYLAYRKPKKDIVSLLTPLYAVLIFFNDAFNPTILLPIQMLYAASLTVLVFRLNARFSRKEEVQGKFIDLEQEEVSDEPLSK